MKATDDLKALQIKIAQDEAVLPAPRAPIYSFFKGHYLYVFNGQPNIANKAISTFRLDMDNPLGDWIAVDDTLSRNIKPS